MEYKELIQIAEKLTKENADGESIIEYLALPAFHVENFIRLYLQSNGKIEHPKPLFPHEVFKLYAIKATRVDASIVLNFEEVSTPEVAYA